MPNTAAGERALRIRRGVAASTFAAAALTLVVAGCGGGGVSPAAGASPGRSSAASASSTATDDELTEPTDVDTEFDDETYLDDTDSYYDDETYDDDTYDDPYGEDTYDSGLYPTLPNSTPYATDTCFNGPHITSTTAIDVYDMNEVDCSSSDAHYKVVKTILDSSDLDACDDVDDAEYAFSESDTDGYGVTSWSAVYCLVGLGSYAVE